MVFQLIIPAALGGAALIGVNIGANEAERALRKKNQDRDNDPSVIAGKVGKAVEGAERGRRAIRGRR